ncbi:MAG: endonuclease MutS2 [Bacilli bacterium]|nr:endonuclease MutS2 [Bacilli bacterium]
MFNSYKVLEFDRIKDMVCENIKTDIGKKYIQDLQAINDYTLLSRELLFVDEMMSLVNKYGNLPLSFSCDLLQLIDFAHKGGVLTPKDLDYFAEDALTANKISTFIRKAEGNFDTLKDYIKDFKDLTNIEKAIHNVISPNLTIYDNASSELASIRRKITSCEAELQTKLNSLIRTYGDLLTDKNITIRNDHFVLPVKNSEKHRVNGIIHDVSDTGQTTFIEPAVIVELNNKIYLLKIEEQEEIKRILRELTKLILNNEDEIKGNNIIIGYLDFVQAKALYGINNNCYVCNLSKEPIIDINNGKHPLLNAKTCIPNSFALNKNERVMVITGPNAGGKTVALKTIGLFVLMNQCGLPVPSREKPTLSIFTSIYLDIGDNQSIQENLSTFSAHMGNIAEITKFINGKSLILIDELGTGTSPREGEALAVSIIRQIIAKNSFAVISSHFEGVKLLAMQSDNIVNASMLFDEEKLLPTYRLRLGMPGKSYGIDVASRLGMPETIVADAREYLLNNSTNVALDDAINKLEKKILETENLERLLKAREQELSERESKAEKVISDIDKIKARSIDEAELLKEKMIKNAEIQLKEIMDNLRKDELKPHMVTAAKKALENIRDDEEEIESADSELYVGDYVKIKESNITGKITRINKSNITIISTDGLTLNVKNNRCIKTIAPKTKTVQKRTIDDKLILGKNVSFEHNVIGMHVDEALYSIEKYLDDARVKKMKNVRLIHGSGTGALRTAIHDFLKKQSFVESYRLGGPGEGGVGATIVTLK